MQIKFYDEKHKEFYNEKMKEITNDSYHQALVYLLGLTQNTRSNFKNLISYDGEYRPCSLAIKPNNINAGWQTGTTYKITRLAFNLFNGYAYEKDEETNEMEISKAFTPYELFCCEFAQYFFEAIRLRYPDYCQKEI